MITYVKNLAPKHQEIFKQIEDGKKANQTRMDEILKQGSTQKFDLDLVKALEKKANQTMTEPDLKSMIEKLVQRMH